MMDIENFPERNISITDSNSATQKTCRKTGSKHFKPKENNVRGRSNKYLASPSDGATIARDLLSCSTLL